MRLLGGGSNVLVRDEGVAGMVISLADPAFSNIDIDGNVVTVGGGANLANAITVTVGAGLAGLGTARRHPGHRSAVRCTATPARTAATSANGPAAPPS